MREKNGAAGFLVRQSNNGANREGEFQEACARGRVEHLMPRNLSSKMMAKCDFAAPHSRGPLFQSFSAWRNIWKGRFVVASSLRRRRRRGSLLAKAPHGPSRTMSFLAALRHEGIAVPGVIDGLINGESFNAHVEPFLAPRLRPGDFVVFDNCGSRKGRQLRAAIGAAGARLPFRRPTRPTSTPSGRSSPN